ncbi:MAG TPA: EthD family reductase [Terriglobia bacterium]|nr:EthD family reductase [Terriglobia bacterium]
MIRLSVMYPKTDDLKFDMAYYRDTHIPMMRRLIGSRLKEFSLDQAVTGQNLPTPYAVIAHLLFESVEIMQAALEEHGPALMADIPHYTNVQAVIQVSETS